MNTKDKILETALNLFNDGNTQMATTNHIAKAMDISPGNLHYHYKNREDIIRVLYKQMREQMSLSIEDLPQNIKQLQEHQKLLLEVFWKYRFFYKELVFLFSRDADLEKMYVQDNLAHKKRIIKSIENFINSGELVRLSDDMKEYLGDVILMTTQFYLSYAKTLGKEIDKAVIQASIKHIDLAFKSFIK